MLDVPSQPPSLRAGVLLDELKVRLAHLLITRGVVGTFGMFLTVVLPVCPVRPFFVITPSC
jgi:hypothetical protein